MEGLFGYIVLEDIPEQAKIKMKNGKTSVPILIMEKKVPSYDYTHFIKAYVRKSEEKSDVNYFIGNARYNEPKQKQEKPKSSVDGTNW